MRLHGACAACAGAIEVSNRFPLDLPSQCKFLTRAAGWRQRACCPPGGSLAAAAAAACTTPSSGGGAADDDLRAGSSKGTEGHSATGRKPKHAPKAHAEGRAALGAPASQPVSQPPLPHLVDGDEDDLDNETHKPSHDEAEGGEPRHLQHAAQRCRARGDERAACSAPARRAARPEAGCPAACPTFRNSFLSGLLQRLTSLRRGGGIHSGP